MKLHPDAGMCVSFPPKTNRHLQFSPMSTKFEVVKFPPYVKFQLWAIYDPPFNLTFQIGPIPFCDVMLAPWMEILIPLSGFNAAYGYLCNITVL